jgi:hypothetical protein
VWPGPAAAFLSPASGPSFSASRLSLRKLRSAQSPRASWSATMAPTQDRRASAYSVTYTRLSLSDKVVACQRRIGRPDRKGQAGRTKKVMSRHNAGRMPGDRRPGGNYSSRHLDNSLRRRLPSLALTYTEPLFPETLTYTAKLLCSLPQRAALKPRRQDLC